MFDLPALIETFGYVGLFAIVFAETGLLIGFFLPGDSLLFTAGILASQGILKLHLLSLVLFVAAVSGDSFGYTFGHKVGRRLFNREDSVFFHKDHLLKAQNFYAVHGKKTIILARFIPIIRTFAPIVAGVGNMHYPTFLTFNIVGGALWAIGVPAVGFYLGKSIPNIDTYLIPIVALIILVSILPGIHEALKTKENRTQILALGKNLISRVKEKATNRKSRKSRTLLENPPTKP